MASKKHKVFRVIWFSFVLIFTTWQWFSYQARGLPEYIFDNSELVTVQEDPKKISFLSTCDSIQTEVILFQGGLVDPDAYAPLCRSIAENGYNCHIVKMNWRMPVWGYNDIKEQFDLDTGRFVLAGHSQGGKMAAQFVFENPGVMKGLILMGTSHPRDFAMNSMTIRTLKLYAEHDGLASVDEVMGNKALLPQNAGLVLIKGGNHSQFGYIGNLLMDSKAEISVQDQQDQMLSVIFKFLMGL